MEERLLNALLSRLPPTKWSLASERAGAIGDYMRIDNPTASDADQAAAALGVKRRMFYELLRNFKEAGASALPNPERSPSRALSAAAVSITETVMTDLGPGAREAEIMRALRERCEDAGVPIPSNAAIRTRLGRPSAEPNLPRRLKRTGDLILDICPLGIDVLNDEGEVKSAGLCALLDMQSGESLSHKTTFGSPTSADICDVLPWDLSRSFNASPSTRRLSLLVATGVPELSQSMYEALAAAGIDADPAQSRSLRGGTPLTAALGIRLGQIPLKPLHRSFDPHRFAAPVTLIRLAQVISMLMDAQNANLKAAAAGLVPQLLRELPQGNI